MTKRTVNFADIIQEETAQHWNVRDDLKDSTLTELQVMSKQDRLPFGVCVLNLTGDLNVGMIIRTACIMGAERVIVLGRRRYDKRSTVGAQNYIDIVRIDALTDDLKFDVNVFDATMKEFEYTPVFLETGEGSYLLQDLSLGNYWPQRTCLVLGNEGSGIPSEMIRDNIHATIPQLGPLRSLNVAVAGGIAMWELSKWLSR